ncbi:hypothetical protein NH340_JMT08662 [Sarcoptes scabiei]|nr:hypothetical protein NH340_JMT08662 [Sarcoptes scabiei]
MEQTTPFQTPLGSRIKSAKLSEVVSTIITYRQKGIQTLIFHSLSILISVTILFLLSQVYYIFLPCLKALLWALLCGSALYPFKTRLDNALRSWLDNLEKSNRSLCFGMILLPFQTSINVYLLIIHFLSDHLIFFLAFHFRFQIGDLLKNSTHILPLLSFHNGFITGLMIFCISIHFVIILFFNSENYARRIFSFNFIPTILMISLIYCFVTYLGFGGKILLLLLLVICSSGMISTAYNLLHESNDDEDNQHRELANSIINAVNSQVKSKVEKLITWFRNKFSDPKDFVDGSETSVGKLFISFVFIISIFTIADHLNVSNLLLGLFCIHWIVKKIFKAIHRNLSRSLILIDKISKTVLEFIGKRFQKDLMFRVFRHFFINGDRMIKNFLKDSIDVMTSIILFLIVAFTIIFCSGFLSIKIYSECYRTINSLQRELKNIEFIQDSINMTLNKISDLDYLADFLNDRLNLKEDEKYFVRKMLLELRQNVLPNIINGSSVNEIREVEEDSEAISSVENRFNLKVPLVFSSITPMISFGNNKIFKKMVKLLSNQATSYLPFLKSLLSFAYAFVFIIFDSSTILMSMVVNFIIFTLALFYLLSSSHEKYRPIEFLDSIVANLVTNHEHNCFSQYVEEIINSIFAATIKISAFYGIYTWLVHSLFGIEICCIPSVIAAILAAIPLLNAYWASFPACIYLYYFDQTFPLVKSFLMFFVAILPSFIVDSSIYSDINRGGHPYLIGLAITCGVVYYGIEGALFGPLWLCLLFIILNIGIELDTNVINQQNSKS